MRAIVLSCLLTGGLMACASPIEQGRRGLVGAHISLKRLWPQARKVMFQRCDTAAATCRVPPSQCVALQDCFSERRDIAMAVIGTHDIISSAYLALDEAATGVNSEDLIDEKEALSRTDRAMRLIADVVAKLQEVIQWRKSLP